MTDLSRRIRLVVAATVAVSVAATTAGAAATAGGVVTRLSRSGGHPPRFRPPPGTVYLGVSTDFDRLAVFDAAAGIAGHPALYGRWTTPDGPVQPILDQAASLRGVTPVVHWNLPLDGGRVADGSQDGYLRAQAAAVKAYRRPVFIRLDWEFNATWYPRWNLPAVTPELFVASWRHVVALFAGVRNVAFVWAPTTWLGPGGLRVDAWWPGDDVVDWVGLDAYPQSASADYLLHGPDGMDEVAALAGAHRKPLMLAEWAPDLPDHPDTAEAVNLVLDWAAAHPVVQALVYFDFVAGGKDYTLVDHPVGAGVLRSRTGDRRRFLTRVGRARRGLCPSAARWLPPCGLSAAEAL